MSRCPLRLISRCRGVCSNIVSFDRCQKFPKSAFFSVLSEWAAKKSNFLPFPSQCSKTCQGGFRVREVRCLADDMTLSNLCDPQLKPEEKESCNPQDCVPEVGK